MAWVTESPAVDATARSPILSIVRAELRQYWWLSLGILGSGLGVWGLLSEVTSRVPAEAHLENVVFNFMGSLVLSMFPLLLAGPVMATGGNPGRSALWFGLPLPRRSVNLIRLLCPLTHAWPALLTWPLILTLLEKAYGPVEPWVVVNAALLVALGLVLSMLTPLAPFLVFLVLPVQTVVSAFIPGGKPFAIVWASVFSSPWMTGAFLAAGSGFFMYYLDSHPRRRG